MWGIKFLSGPKAGKEVLLQKGLTILGRDKSCQITVPSKNISKKHAQIVVNDLGVTIEDLNSSNGTFYKGKKIRSQNLEVGDRVAVNDIVFEVIKKSNQVHPYFQHYANPYPAQQQYQDIEQKPDDLDLQKINKGIKGYIHGYVHNVILPGVYKLAEWLEFKWVIGFFVVGFVFLVMIFSSVPLVQILKSSVEQESKNHAESIAVTLSKINREHLKSGLHTAISVAYAQRRPGVQKAFIVDAVKGYILAPSELAHTYPKEAFIHKARKLDKHSVEKIASSTVGAVVPISMYNAESGQNTPVAYAAVIYDMGALSVGNAKILSLLIQNLFIATVLGVILFFFLINLIEFPLRSINHQFNEALKNNKSSMISTSYESSSLSELCNHINAALNQISLNQMMSNNQKEEPSPLDTNQPNRHKEMANLVEIVGFPCLAIDLYDNSVSALNSNLTEQLGYQDILNQPVKDIADNDLKEHLDLLLDQGQSNPEEISFGEVYLKDMQIQTACQFVMGAQGPAYAIITFMPAEKEEVA